MHKKILFVLLFIIISISALAFYMLRTIKTPETFLTNDKPLVVKIMLAKRIPLSISFELLGTVLPKHESKLASLTEGFVDEVFIHTGQRVGKGQVLATLDHQQLQYQLDDINAQLLVIHKKILREETELKHNKFLLKTEEKILSLKENQLKRYKELLRQNSVGHSAHEAQEQVVLNEKSKVRNIKFDINMSTHDLNILNNQEKQLQARINSSKYKIEKMIIRAPYAGVIYQRRVSAGDHVTSGETLFEIYSENEIEVVASLPYQYQQVIKEAIANKETILATLSNGVKLKLNRLSNIVNKGELGRELFFSIIGGEKPVMNSKQKLKIFLPQKLSFYVPKNVLYAGSKIYIVNNNRLQEKQVKKLGMAQVNKKNVYVITSENLKEGEQILISYLGKPRSGELVRVSP